MSKYLMPAIRLRPHYLWPRQVGCVIVPTIGVEGGAGCPLMTTLADTGEIHPPALVTVKLYVPVANPDRVVVVPVPVVPPGFNVQCQCWQSA